MIADLVVDNLGWINDMAMRLCSNSADAKDLAAETICRCLINANKYNPDKPFKPWVCAIMHNLLVDECRRAARMLCDDIRQLAIIAEDKADQEIAVKSIITLISQYARSKNIECVMLYAEGYSYSEIADMLNVNIGTVKSRISNGRRFLRDALR